MIKFGFEGPDGQWRYAIEQYDAAEESSVWHVRAAHVPFATQKHVKPKDMGIYKGYFEVEGSATPSTLTLVAAACRVVEDEINQT